MNLHGLVDGCISMVNPPTGVTLKASHGFTVSPDGTQVPVYRTVEAQVQVQALSAHELQHIAGMGIQGVVRKLYAYGELNSIIRQAEKGGDLIEMNCRLWKIVHVFETWPDWSAAAIRLQVDA